jgi:hypothetical protein
MSQAHADDAAAERTVLRTGTALECFCPSCGETLVEGEHLKLNVERASGERGLLRLSPFLNVFECSSTIGLPEGEEVADLVCPRCGRTLKVPHRACGDCGSGAARLHVRVESERVDFFICMRKSCHWHGISEAVRSRLILETAGFRDPINETELIQTGTRLQCHCPHCKGSLVSGEDIVVAIEDTHGNGGTLQLSPYLNVFRAECSLPLARGEEVAEMKCRACNASLMSATRRCQLCGARSARFRVKTAYHDVDFHICARRMCHWHGLDDESRRRVRLDGG